MQAILASIALIILLFFTASVVIPLSIQSPSEASGSSRCPNGYHRSPSGDCEKVRDLPDDLPRCPNGFHRSPDGDCERVEDGPSVSGNNNDDNDDDTESDSSNTDFDNIGSNNNNNVENTNVIPSTQRQIQGQFPRYESPALGISVQHPPDWLLVGKSDDKLHFVKDAVEVEVVVDDVDSSYTTLAEYANKRVDELREQRTDFQLIEFDPVTISEDKPAQRVVYSFTGEDGITKVIRTWSVYQGKLYTIAYIADSSQYDQYLPIAQQMIDSFEIGTSSDINSKQLERTDQGQSPTELTPGTLFSNNEEVSQAAEANRFEARVQLEPSDQYEDYYDVSNFVFTVTPIELCTTRNCEFKFEGGQMGPEYTPGERILTGKLRIETGDVGKITDVFVPWDTVEERIGEDGKKIQFIEGTFGIGRDVINPDFEYQINGTMTSNGENFIVTLQGEKEES